MEETKRMAIGDKITVSVGSYEVDAYITSIEVFGFAEHGSIELTVKAMSDGTPTERPAE